MKNEPANQPKKAKISKEPKKINSHTNTKFK